jgi:DNA-binding LytR/AlgR family response regulator
MRVVIIEDEPFAQKALVQMLEVCVPNVEVVECLDSVEDSIEFFKGKVNVDLAFFDIQLADGLSFEVFKQVEVLIPIIFTTAFNEYAIEAFKVNSIDYLLKPFVEGDVKRALDKFQKISIGGRGVSQDLLKNMEQLIEQQSRQEQVKSRFLVKVGDEIKFVQVNDIAYFYAEDNEVLIRNFQGKRYIVEHTLDTLQEMVNPKHFFRLNRSFLASIDSIDKIHKYLNSRLKLQLKPVPDKEVLISRVKVAAFLQWIER